MLSKTVLLKRDTITRSLSFGLASASVASSLSSFGNVIYRTVLLVLILVIGYPITEKQGGIKSVNEVYSQQHCLGDQRCTGHL